MRDILLPKDGICGVCEVGIVNGHRKTCSAECSTWRDRCRRAGYVLSRKEYDNRVVASQGRCNACGTKADLQVDHCLETGVVRGLLCNNCNSALAHARDSIERLYGLIGYLSD